MNENPSNKLTEKKALGRKHSKKTLKGNSRELLFVTYFFIALFLGMIVYMGIFMGFKSDSFINNPYNKRIALQSEKVIRGNIVTIDGKVIATTHPDENGNDKRYFPENDKYSIIAGHTLGDGLGIEKALNFELLSSHTNFVSKFINDILGDKQPGDTVVTTLDSKLQDVAYKAMRNKTGAVVVINSATGEILAMVSTPGFNPNKIDSQWEDILSSKDAVLYNRATKGLYPPGSTFKLVTTLEALRENPSLDNDYFYECDGDINIDGSIIHCYNNSSHGKLDIASALAKSCNCAFADIGVNLNTSTFTATAQDLLFNKDLPVNCFEYNKSSFNLKDADNAMIARSSIGQGDVLVSPYHMCLIAAAIQNDGMLMQPKLIDSIKNISGRNVKKFKNEEYKKLLSKKEAKKLKKLMKNVAKNGTAKSLYNKNYTVASKTGSAEFSNVKGESHAWFVGFAENKDSDPIAIAVLVENGGSGSHSAVPIAKDVFDSYFLQ